jgi:hypothetical protein
MKKNISNLKELLKNKRYTEMLGYSIMELFRDDDDIIGEYENFLLNFYNSNLPNSSDENQKDLMKSLTFRQNVNKPYIYIYKRLKDYIFNNENVKKERVKDGKKLIGIVIILLFIYRHLKY